MLQPHNLIMHLLHNMHYGFESCRLAEINDEGNVHEYACNKHELAQV